MKLHKSFFIPVIFIAIIMLFATTLSASDNPFIPRLENSLSAGLTANTIKSLDSTYFFNIGERLNFRDFDIKMCYRIPSTKFSTGFKNDYATYDKFTNIGAAFRLHKIVSVPITFMAGRLNVTGSFSKLKIPYLSTSVRNFCDIISLPQKLTLNLPTSLTVTKPATFAALYNSKGVADKLSLTGPVVKKLDCAFLSNENGDFATSSSIILKLCDKNFLGFSQTLLLCKIESKSSSWFSAVELFPPTQYWFSNNELYYSNPHFKAKFTANIYQMNSKITSCATFSLESNLIFKYFMLGLGGFYATNDITFLPNGSVLKIAEQIKINPLFIIPTKAAIFKIGGTYYIENRFNAKYKSCVNQKWGAGFMVTKNSGLGKISFECTDNEEESTQYKIISYLALKTKAAPTFNAAYTFYEDITKKNTLSLTSSQRFLQKKDKGVTISLALKESLVAVLNNTTNDYLTAGLGLHLTHRAKYVNTICSLAIKCKIGLQ